MAPAASLAPRTVQWWSPHPGSYPKAVYSRSRGCHVTEKASERWPLRRAVFPEHLLCARHRATHAQKCSVTGSSERPSGALSLLGRLRQAAELAKGTARKRPTWRGAFRLQPQAAFQGPACVAIAKGTQSVRVTTATPWPAGLGGSAVTGSSDCRTLPYSPGKQPGTGGPRTWATWRCEPAADTDITNQPVHPQVAQRPRAGRTLA